jgi:hypothetical protein
MKPIVKTLLWLTFFSIAMGYLETAVVVYLRQIYYAGGFSFPLQPIQKSMAATEFWREAATIIMLVGAGALAGKNRLQRYAFFLFCFGIWDIFYYIFLKLLLNWPASITDWDLLFLIPAPWIGPVLAPVIVSLSMILFCLVIVWLQDKGYEFKIRKQEWFLQIGGCLVIIFSFIYDYVNYILRKAGVEHVWSLRGKGDLFRETVLYKPSHYNWCLFATGEIMLLLTIVLIIARVTSRSKEKSSLQYKSA